MQLLAVLIIKLLNILTWIIIIQCLMSWIPSARYSRAYEILSMCTEPVVGPIREILFKYIDVPVDFSPIIAFFIIELVQKIIINLVW